MPDYEMISGPAECNPCCTPPVVPPPPTGDPGDGSGNIQFFCEYYYVSRIGSPAHSFRHYRAGVWTITPASDADYTEIITPNDQGAVSIPCGVPCKFVGDPGLVLTVGENSYNPGDTFTPPIHPVSATVAGTVVGWVPLSSSASVRACREFENIYSISGSMRGTPVWSKKPNFPSGFDPNAALAPAGQNQAEVPLQAIAWNTSRMLQLISDWADDVCATREYVTFTNQVSQRRLTSHRATELLLTKSYAYETAQWPLGNLRLDCTQRSYPVGYEYWKTNPQGFPSLTVIPMATDGHDFPLAEGFPTIAGRFYYCNGGSTFNGLQTDGVVVYNQDGSIANLVIDQESGLPLLGTTINHGQIFMAKMNFCHCSDNSSTLVEVPMLPAGNAVVPGWQVQARSWLEACMTRLPSTAQIVGGVAYFHPFGPLFDWWCPGRDTPPYGGDTTQLPASSSSAQIGGFDLSTIIGRWYDILVGVGGAVNVGGRTVYTQYTVDNSLGAFLVGVLGNQPNLASFAANRLVVPSDGQPLFGREVVEKYHLLPTEKHYKVTVSVPQHCIIGGMLCPSNSTVMSVAEIVDNELISPQDGEVVFIVSPGLTLKQGTTDAPSCGGNDVSGGSGKAGMSQGITWAGGSHFINGALDWTGETGTDESDIDPTTGTVDYEEGAAPTVQSMQASLVRLPSIDYWAMSSKFPDYIELVVGSYENGITFEVRAFVPAQPWENLPIVGEFSNGDLFNSLVYSGFYKAAFHADGFVVRARNLAGVLSPGVQMSVAQAAASTVRPRLTFVANGSQTLGQIAPTFRAGVALDRETTYGGFTVILRNSAGQALHTFSSEGIDYGMGTADGVSTSRRYHTLRPGMVATNPGWEPDRRRVEGIPGNGTSPYCRYTQTDHDAPNGDYNIAAGTYHIIW